MSADQTPARVARASAVTALAAAEELTDDDLAAHYPFPAGDWLRVNCVSSIDGAAEVGGVSGPLSFPVDQRLLRLLRAQCDAVLVGAGTVRAEGYGPLHADPAAQRWRRSHRLTDQPTLVVVSGSLGIDPDSPALREAPTRPVVLTSRSAPPARRTALAAVADVLDAGDDRVDLPAALALLRDRGLRRLHCEGGPRLLGALIDADLVDEVCLTLSPVLAGGDAARIAAGQIAGARRLGLRHVLRVGDALLLRYCRAG